MQPVVAQQGYPQQRAAPPSAGPQSSPPTGLPPPPDPDSLPRPQNFSAPGKATSLTRGEYTSNLPQPRSNTATARPKKMRKGRMVVRINLFLVLVGSGVGAFMVLRQGNNGPAKPTAHATATATATATTQPSDSTSGTVGQPLQVGQNWVVTVTHTRTTKTSDYPPKTGYTYLEISPTLKNPSANTQFVSSLVEFTLADASGGQYTESVKDTNIRQAVDGHVPLGQTLTGQIAYEVPLSQQHFLLIFHYGLPDGNSSAVSSNITT